MHDSANHYPELLVDNSSQLFEKIATELLNTGMSINSNSLPLELSQAILNELNQISIDDFVTAGIGRHGLHSVNPFVRSNSICWIEGQTYACQLWNEWAQQLQLFLNRRLYLGLVSFESHFAHYSKGDFYKRHYDAFKDIYPDDFTPQYLRKPNRTLSVVAYFNTHWSKEDGGELVIYADDNDFKGIQVVPQLGHFIVFLSEEFPHEVLPSQRDRYSIAGWYRS